MKALFKQINKFARFQHRHSKFPNNKEFEIKYDYEFPHTNKSEIGHDFPNHNSGYTIDNIASLNFKVDFIKDKDKKIFTVMYNHGSMTKEAFRDFIDININKIKIKKNHTFVIKQDNMVIFYNDKTKKFKGYSFD